MGQSKKKVIDNEFFNTFFIRLKGIKKNESKRNQGFVVNCFIHTDHSIDDFENVLLQDLKDSQLEVVNILNKGEYKNFTWDISHSAEITELVKLAVSSPNEIQYGPFHSWLI